MGRESMHTKGRAVYVAPLCLAVLTALGESRSLRDITPAGDIPAGVGTHVLLVMLFVLAADVAFCLYKRRLSPEADASLLLLQFLSFAGSGLSLALSTGYFWRAHALTRRYAEWSRLADIKNDPWLETLPDRAADFRAAAVAFAILTVVTAAAAVFVSSCLKAAEPK